MSCCFFYYFFFLESVPSILERVGNSIGSRKKDSIMNSIFHHDEEKNEYEETGNYSFLSESNSLFSGTLSEKKYDGKKLNMPLKSSSQLISIENEALTRSLQLSLCRNIFSLADDDDDDQDFGEKKEVPILTKPVSKSNTFFHEFEEFKSLFINKNKMDISI